MKKIIYVLVTLGLMSCSNHQILKENVTANIDRMQVKLSSKVSKEELTDLANELREERMNYDKLWINFYLPDLLPDESGNGAWATASFTPGLEVTILGDKNSSNEVLSEAAFPKYTSIVDMLKASSDFKENCIEDLSKNNNTHVRVSSEFLNTEDKKTITDQVKRDLVYVIFQTFAQTDLDNVTITSIPILKASFNPNSKDQGELENTYGVTATATRVKAIGILKKHLNISSFKELYTLDETVYLPNEKFERLKFGKLDEVFKDFTNK
jgi:hypothetical protein